ncbi:hypothetical protein LJR219_005034 [Phenylobacterium sp. LjRoot219]|uniref:hypothetical protein n=1 Tax=Phenylobacterium sp. LjRoot219 TaxID=3342283 RepID=UPI003ECD94E7
MASLDFDWMQLSHGEQLREWGSFLRGLDAGDAGYHRYYRVLMPRWARGDVPQIVGQAAGFAGFQEEAACEWFDAGTADQVLGPPPF